MHAHAPSTPQFFVSMRYKGFIGRVFASMKNKEVSVRDIGQYRPKRGVFVSVTMIQLKVPVFATVAREVRDELKPSGHAGVHHTSYYMSIGIYLLFERDEPTADSRYFDA
jgi:hypothetical protein